MSLIKIQPVRPDPTPTDIAGDVAGGLLASGLGAMFVMIAAGNLHRLWPVVPPVGYWTTLGILLGLSSIRFALRGSGWKWANS